MKKTRNLGFRLLITLFTTEQFVKQSYLKDKTLQEQQQDFVDKVSSILDDGLHNFHKALTEYKNSESITKVNCLATDITQILKDINHDDKAWRLSKSHYSSYLKNHCQSAIIATMQNKIREILETQFKEINMRIVDLLNFHFLKKMYNSRLDHLDITPNDIIDFLFTYAVTIAGASTEVIRYADLSNEAVHGVHNIVESSFNEVFQHSHGISEIFWNRKDLVEELTQKLLALNKVIPTEIINSIEALFKRLKNCVPEAAKLLLHEQRQFEDIPDCEMYKQFQLSLEELISILIDARL